MGQTWATNGALGRKYIFSCRSRKRNQNCAEHHSGGDRLCPTNPKSELRNPKQIENTEFETLGATGFVLGLLF
jgi:hypothetical protein